MLNPPIKMSRGMIVFCLFWYSQSNFLVLTRNRFAKFQILDFDINNNWLSTNELTLQSYFQTSKPRCGLFCLKNAKCLTFAFISHFCSLISVDPRVNVTSFSNEISEALHHNALYGMSQDNDSLNCFVDQSELSRVEKEAECDMAYKIIDAECSITWSNWEYYSAPICPGMLLKSLRSRNRYCSKEKLFRFRTIKKNHYYPG